METSIAVSPICETDGGPEIYRLSGPWGQVEFTWDSWEKIKGMIDVHHEARHTLKGSVACGQDQSDKR